MADPKYANLVGIAYDQPDVYETKDLPEADQNAGIYEEESDSIERLHISATTALSKFKGKPLDSANVDFSDRLSRRIRTGYTTRSGDWELAGEGEKETPIQKYQRLQCEMKELLEEVADLKEAVKDETNKQPTADLHKQLNTFMKQLSDLRLEEKLGAELVSSLTDPQGAHLKKLLSQLDQFQAPAVQPQSHRGAGEGLEEGTNPVVKYRLAHRPGHTELAQTARLAELEQRLARIEQAVGATPAKLSRLNSDNSSLLATAQGLASQASLLDASQLDSAESRLTTLLTRLDQIAEKSAVITGSSDPEREKKINELYELAKKTEHLSQILPHTLDRMRALQHLHHQGGEFAKSVSELESAQVQLSAKAKENSFVLSKIEENMTTFFNTIKTDLSNLDSRVKAFSAKK